ncbi:MAG: SAM-dependent methyltransferase [Pedosphaera sp.]|nr:SAM-dependent methyltransferase [Pedosphaera sp.]
MVFASPVPAEMATGAFYDDAGGEYLSPDKLASDYADVRFERELRLFRSYCTGGAVLDVGCSSGGFLHQLTKRYPNDYKVLGTDVSTAPLEHAAKMGVPVARGDFLTHPFSGQFDAVTFWAVMEHLSEPRRFLERAASLLKPGGFCFILVPNLNSLAVRLLGSKYRYIFPEHINYFTPATLRKFAEREFTVLALKSTHFNPVVIWQDFRRGEREVPRAERSRLLKRTNAYKQSRWLWPLKLAYRATERSLGRFRLADNLVLIGKKEISKAPVDS